MSIYIYNYNQISIRVLKMKRFYKSKCETGDFFLNMTSKGIFNNLNKNYLFYHLKTAEKLIISTFSGSDTNKLINDRKHKY